MIKTCFFIILFTLIILSNVIANDLKPYKVYLKEGTVLTSLVDKKDQRITRGIYVYVLETDYQKRDMFIVYDKNMKPAFETTALGVVEIKKDIAILPEVDAEVIYPPPTVLNASNKMLFLILKSISTLRASAQVLLIRCTQQNIPMHMEIDMKFAHCITLPYQSTLACHSIILQRLGWLMMVT